jgi:hypothetical protein
VRHHFDVRKKQSMKTTHLLIVVIAAASLSSCATITRGTKEVFAVDSTPQNAAVQLSTGQSGQTPASFKVPRRESLHVTISKDGYKTRQITVPSQISGGGGVAMAGNVLLGGLIGAGVDAGTGAMYDHKPNPLHVHLERK